MTEQSEPRFVPGSYRAGAVGVFDMKTNSFSRFQWDENDEQAAVRAKRAAQWLNDGSMTPSGFVWEKLPKDVRGISAIAVRPPAASESRPAVSTKGGASTSGRGPYSPAEWAAWGEHDGNL